MTTTETKTTYERRAVSDLPPRTRAGRVRALSAFTQGLIDLLEGEALLYPYGGKMRDLVEGVVASYARTATRRRPGQRITTQQDAAAEGIWCWWVKKNPKDGAA